VAILDDVIFVPPAVSGGINVARVVLIVVAVGVLIAASAW